MDKMQTGQGQLNQIAATESGNLLLSSRQGNGCLPLFMKSFKAAQQLDTQIKHATLTVH